MPGKSSKEDDVALLELLELVLVESPEDPDAVDSDAVVKPVSASCFLILVSCTACTDATKNNTTNAMTTIVFFSIFLKIPSARCARKGFLLTFSHLFLLPKSVPSEARRTDFVLTATNHTRQILQH